VFEKEDTEVFEKEDTEVFKVFKDLGDWGLVLGKETELELLFDIKNTEI